jgi:hypothetical protein
MGIFNSYVSLPEGNRNSWFTELKDDDLTWFNYSYFSLPEGICSFKLQSWKFYIQTISIQLGIIQAQLTAHSDLYIYTHVYDKQIVKQGLVSMSCFGCFGDLFHITWKVSGGDGDYIPSLVGWCSSRTCTNPCYHGDTTGYRGYQNMFGSIYTWIWLF